MFSLFKFQHEKNYYKLRIEYRSCLNFTEIDEFKKKKNVNVTDLTNYVNVTDQKKMLMSQT